MENPFLDRATAERYARSRPDLSSHAVAALESVLAAPVDLAVDVGCGTGYSTRALRSVARRVVGIDSSAAMIAAAEGSDGVEYRVGDAGSIPMGDGSCGLMAAGLSFHWFDRDAFLAEARRVLEPDGRLALWNAGCAGRGEPGVDAWAWFGGPYLRENPSPPRDARPFGDDEARAAGFEAVARVRLEQTLAFTRDAFVDFLTTQSNVIERVRGNPELLAQAVDRLRRETEPFFRGGTTEWLFAGWLAVFRRR
jgi:SAM-dependent methyltransferase